MKYSLLNHIGKRPNNCWFELKKELLNYLKEEFEKGNFPSKREIQNKFHLRLDCPIEKLYDEAGIKYKLAPNQNLKYLKANLLLRLILKNLDKFNLNLIKYREVNEKGVDILAKRKDKLVGIEIKAYNKNEKIKLKDIAQVKNFLINEKIEEVIIITTADINRNLIQFENISIIYFNQLAQLFISKEDKEILSFVRNESINTLDLQKEIKKQKILDYVYNKYKNEGKKPGCNEIAKELHFDVYSYFQNLFEVYGILKIPPPLWNLGIKRTKNPNIEFLNLWKDEFKTYILEQIKNENKYPSGEELAKHFGIGSIWNIVKVSELYEELGLKPYHKRGKR